MSDLLPRPQCCGKRPDKTRGVGAQDLPELFPLLKQRPTEPGTFVILFDCTACGQIWEEHLIPFMHADVHVVVKEGVAADLEDPRPPASPPVPEPPEPPEVRRDRQNRRIFWACTFAGIVLGFATQPPRSAGSSEIGTHRLSCFVGGMTAGALINLVRGLRKP